VLHTNARTTLNIELPEGGGEQFMQFLAYSGTCPGCRKLFRWRLVGPIGNYPIIPPSTIPLLHLCTEPASEVPLTYEGEILDDSLAPYLP